MIGKYKIVVLCGSTRFFKTFDEQNCRLTLEGNIVLSIGCNSKSDEHLNLSEDQKLMLDDLHKRKIDLSDSIFVINVDGYIGSSTQSEINYAISKDKPVEYLVPICQWCLKPILNINEASIYESIGLAHLECKLNFDNDCMNAMCGDYS